MALTVTDNSVKQINAALLSLEKKINETNNGIAQDKQNVKIELENAQYEFISPLKQNGTSVSLDTTGVWEGTAVKAVNAERSYIADSADITKTEDTENGDKLQIGNGKAVNVTNAVHAVNAERSYIADSADITKTEDTENGDKLQIGNGKAVNVTNAVHAVNADKATSADIEVTTHGLYGDKLQIGNGKYALIQNAGHAYISDIARSAKITKTEDIENGDKLQIGNNELGSQEPVNITNAKHAKEADNATNAVHATNADKATSADKADNATNAVHATNADKATSADKADNATNAVHAVNADKATSADKADKVTNALTVNGKTYDGSSAVNAGVQTVANGGTGQTTAEAAANSFINSLSTGGSVPVDDDYYISQYVNGGTTTITYHRRPVSKLWEYIKGKISSVLGLTATNYGGKATNADKATSADITKTVDTTNGDKLQIGTGIAINVTNAKHSSNADKATSADKADKVTNALTVNGKTYDGSSAVNAGVQTVANGGTGATTAKGAEYNIIGGVETVDTDLTDSRYFALRNETISSGNGSFRWNKVSKIKKYTESNYWYGTCSTSSSTVAKAVSITDFSLTKNVRVTVKFTNANTATNATLNINSTGAKPIYYKGTNVGNNIIDANSTVNLVYNGTQYEIVGDFTPTTSSVVTGVKGEAEDSYRDGNVNITKADLGLTTDTLGIKWYDSNITSGSYNTPYYANGLWVIGGDGIKYSTDGKTWTSSNTPGSTYYSPYYANEVWVISGYGGGILYSTDGKTWTSSNITSGSYDTPYYANGLWVIGSRDNKGIKYSTDGKTWTSSNITSGKYNAPYYANGLWVISSDSKGIKYSTDGKTWTSSNITSGSYYSPYYANEVWVIGSGYGDGIKYSTDGKTWTSSNITSGSYNTPYYANGLWVIGGDGIKYSTDGKTWTSSNITSGSYSTPYYANGLWVIGSYSKGILYSTDGKTWTVSNITSKCNTPYYANGLWVIGSYINGIKYSTFNSLNDLGYAFKGITELKSYVDDTYATKDELKNRIKTKEIEVGSFTVTTENCYAIHIALPEGSIPISVYPTYWAASSGVFSIVCYTRSTVYVLANNGTSISGLNIRVVYI